jgi:hypothetical protein
MPDVIVAGGGAAGVGAALGAAATGAHVTLLERAPFLGGAATLSNVLTYCGFWTQADPPLACVGGAGRQVLDEIALLGVDVRPQRMSVSGVVVALIEPEAVKLALDRILARAGVEVILHARIAGATAENDRVRDVRVLDHRGEFTLTANAYVDGSGEADLAYFSGAATRFGDVDGRHQNGTLAVRFGGIDRDADISRGTWERAIVAAKARGVAPLTKEHGLVVRMEGSGDVLAFLADEAYDARDAYALSGAERHAREQAWAYLEAIRSLPGHERAHIVASGPMIGTRESRHIVAPYALTTDDVLSARTFDDTVALGGWPVEFHGGPGTRSIWKRIADDRAYGIPLRSLHSVDRTNLFAAGRTLDADPYAFSSLRVMGTAFATGQAAGVAAAYVAAGTGAAPDDVRAELRRQGAILDLFAAIGEP